MAALASAVGEAWRELKSAAALARMQMASALGRGPRLPPGSLGPGGIARLGHEDFYLRKFRRHGPIFKVLWNRNLAVCIVGFQRARRLLAQHAKFLAPVHIDIRSFVPHGFLRTMDAEPHQRYRTLFLGALRADPPAVWEPDIRGVMRDALFALADATEGRAAPDAAALMRCLDRCATRALLIQFFGMTPADPTLLTLDAGYHRLGPDGFVFPIGPEQVDAFHHLRAIVGRVVDDIKGSSPASPAQGVLAQLVAQGDPSGTDDTALGNLIYMLEIGRYDVRGLLRWVLKYLSDHPAVVDELGTTRTDAGAFAALAEGCVLETLRLDQAEAMNRQVLDDIVFEGFRIPKGCAVRLLMRETHKDADVFPEPEEYRPCRFAGKTYLPDDFAPFGVGEHRCLVGPMVVRLCAIFVEEIVTHFTWTVVGDGPRFRGRHHWEPSPTFAVALQPRSAAGRLA